MLLGLGHLCNATLGFWVAGEESSEGAEFGCSRIGLQADPVSVPQEQRAASASPAPTAWAAACLQLGGLFSADASGKLGHGHRGEDVRFVMR